MIIFHLPELLFWKREPNVDSIIMSNFHMDVTARDKPALELTLKLALMAERQATHWCNHPHKGLVLFWSKPDPVVRSLILPRPILNDLPTRGTIPGERVVVRKNSYNTSYVWTSVQDDGGDPQSWVWKIVAPLTEDIPVHPLPCKMTKPEQLAMFVQGWLDEAEYGREPDHDGDNEKGFRIYNDRWGQVEDCGSYSFVAIQPKWAEIGK